MKLAVFYLAYFWIRFVIEAQDCTCQELPTYRQIDHFHSTLTSFVSIVIYSITERFRAWEQICAPAVPLTTSDTQARIATFSPATSPWLLWIRKHDTKNFSSPMKVSLCAQRRKRDKKKLATLSASHLSFLKVTLRKPGCETSAVDVFLAYDGLK